MPAGVTDLRYIGLTVPDLEAERAFFKHPWGLTEVASEGEMAYFAAAGSCEPFVIRIRQAPTKGLDIIGLAAASRQDVDDLYAKLQAHGAKTITAPGPLTSPGGGYGFRAFDCDGHVLEISSDVTPGPSRELSRGESIPRELSHIVMHAPDRQKTEDFYTGVLGFRVSDWIGDFMSFLRCNPIHHRLALLPGPPAFNHVAFEMRDVDEMMRGVGRLRRENLKLDWGPGRHTAGNNTFSYFQTPNGHVVEYTAGLDRVDEASWTPTRYAPETSIMDQWGTAEGGPEHMPQPVPDPGLWQPVTV